MEIMKKKCFFIMQFLSNTIPIIDLGKQFGKYYNFINDNNYQIIESLNLDYNNSLRIPNIDSIDAVNGVVDPIGIGDVINMDISNVNRTKQTSPVTSRYIYSMVRSA